MRPDTTLPISLGVTIGPKPSSSTGSDFFGSPWPSGICDAGIRVATPVGSSCVDCSERIASDDRGTFIGTADGQAPVHRECILRSVLGGIEHLTAGPHEAGECRHESGLSRRASAIAAWEWVRENGVPTG